MQYKALYSPNQLCSMNGRIYQAIDYIIDTSIYDWDSPKDKKDFENYLSGNNSFIVITVPNKIEKE
jgi:hypothetical protein